MSFIIRKAVESDVPVILRFIRDLAEYEKLSHEVVATEDTIRGSMFSINPKTYGLIAEVDGKPVGFAVYFYNFSTFLGRNGIYIEDVYVMPEHRGAGIGKAIFKYLAAQAVAEGCGRLEWWVLDWNKPAIDFYLGMGAISMSEWTVQRIQGDALKALAATYNIKDVA